MSTITKAGIFTDIHFGRRGNEALHNQDCLDFITWFCARVQDEQPSHVVFMGDWFECRNALNIETMDYSYRGLKQLDALGIPVIFIVGNHDLHRRTTREVHSVSIFQELKNFTVVDQPKVIDGCLFSPFLFDHEYPSLAQYNHLDTWFGHFEFKGFAMTGYNMIMEHGPDPMLFKGPKQIFSGHFHKRQASNNIVYIGNAFPMDMGDAGDNARGCAFYDRTVNKTSFYDWAECPKYLKVSIDDILVDKWEPKPKMKVRCIINNEVTYSQAQELKEALIIEYGLRDFILDENRELKQGLLEGDTAKVTDVLDATFDTIDELVVTQLKLAVEDPLFKNTYNVDTLVSLYESLNVELKEGETA